MSYNVYLVSSSGLPMDHHAIFIETHESGPKTGYIYQVTGNIQTGMVHGHRQSDIPEDMPDFAGVKKLLGTVEVGDYERVRTVVDSVEVPGKQFDGPKRLGREPLRRCQEWTREAIDKLLEEGVLKPCVTESGEGF